MDMRAHLLAGLGRSEDTDDRDLGRWIWLSVFMVKLRIEFRRGGLVVIDAVETDLELFHRLSCSIVVSGKESD